MPLWFGAYVVLCDAGTWQVVDTRTGLTFNCGGKGHAISLARKRAAEESSKPVPNWPKPDPSLDSYGW